jgi:hypothetical protein
MHLLKNGHPAHVFTDEDRRKAAAVTNEIRREKRALLEQLRLNREIEQMLARDAARRERRREKQRHRREAQKAKLDAIASTPTRRSELHYRVDTLARAAAGAPVGSLPVNEQQALELGLTGPVDIGRARPFDPGRYEWV